MQLFQDNDSGPLAILAITLVSLGIVGGIFLSPIKERVYIDKDLNISTDTIIQENSRWFYTSDSSQKEIILSVYREKTGKPYEEIYMQPDDYIDLDLKYGTNIIHLRTLGKYPFVYKRYKIFQCKEKKVSISHKLKHILMKK